MRAECADWSVPLNHENPDGERISVTVTRLASTAPEPAEDAFVLINGGPGGSSIDMLVDFGGIGHSFTRERDVIVIDQRGTGRSSKLTCASVTDTTEVPDEYEVLAMTEECLAELPHDPRYFTTTSAVDDLEKLRQALGYEQLSLYGVSYGTRVVMQYMRTYPEQARVAVIDGVVPPTQALGELIAIHSQNVLEQTFERCTSNQDCAKAFPDLERNFISVRERLKAESIDLRLNHPVTGEPTDLALNYNHMALWLRLSLYGPEAAALIPVALKQAADGNYLPIAANALRIATDLNEALSYGMHNAVMCTEDTPFYDEQNIDREAMAASYLGAEMYDMLKQMCSAWPAGVRDEAIKDPLESDIPTLVLSGEFDPITPPAWGEAVLLGLTNARHIVAPGQGHGVLPRGCMPTLVREFVETADAEGLDTTCVEFLHPHPFFINSMGPPP